MSMRLALVAVVGIVMVLTTAMRVPIWTDEQALWRDAVLKAPLKPRPWVNLGKQYHLRGQADLAEGAYQTAILVARQSERSRDEQTLGRGLAEANLALLWTAHGRQVEGWTLIQNTLASLPSNLDIDRAYRAIRDAR